MKLKLDENLGVRGKEVLLAEGHDTATVVEQGYQAATDDQLAGLRRRGTRSRHARSGFCESIEVSAGEYGRNRSFAAARKTVASVVA